jgi:hypothetical protein
MSLLTVLKSMGKDLKDVAGWIEDGLKIVDKPIEAVDPALGPILTAVEALLAEVDPQNQTPALVQSISTAIAAVPTSAVPAVVSAIKAAIAVPPKAAASAS